MAQRERRSRYDQRFFFRSPKQEEKQIIFNLSKRGALFAGTEPVEIGQKISLEVTLPKGLAELKLPGKVRWVKRVGEGEQVLFLTGLQFDEQDESTAAILEAYLQFLHRDRAIQKSRSMAISNLEKWNRLLTLEFLKKEGLPDTFQ
jgi:Tfp pilus assembly protein PilZ